MNREDFKLYDKCKKLFDRRNELDDIITYQQSSLPKKELVALKKEFSNLDDVFSVLKGYLDLVNEHVEYEGIISDNSDAEMVEFAKMELEALSEKLKEFDESVKQALLPKDNEDASNVILEVRAGTGGDEAALFAEELFRMYIRYAEKRKWKFEIMDISHNELGGYKEASGAISGKNVFGDMKFESGTHRVQRVPATESKGRVHTSAVTVAILPEPEDIEIDIDDKDLRVDIYRSSGCGGQGVNTTDSAVRLTHIPTGLVVTQQDERSQHKNKNKAMRVLKARLYELEREKQHSTIANNRKSQIGSGDRSDKIRTYNFPQDRITDHRIKDGGSNTVNNIIQFMEGGRIGLDKLVDQLKINRAEEYFRGEE